MARNTTRTAHTAGAATATNSPGPGATAGVSTRPSHAALHLRSFAAGAVMALLLSGAASLALRWTPAPAIVLHAPPTAQPTGPVPPPATPAVPPATALPPAPDRSLGLPTPTLAAGAAPPAESAPALPGATNAGTPPAEDLPTADMALVNLNTATAAELEALPGIGPTKAQAIIAHRPYNTVEDLDGVPGIGPATLERLRPLVVVE